MFFAHKEFIVFLQHYEDLKVVTAGWGFEVEDGCSNLLTILAVHYFAVLAIGIYISSLILYLLNYNNYAYLFYWLPEQWKENNFIFICSIFYESYVFLCVGLLFAIYFFMGLIVLFPIVSIMSTVSTSDCRNFLIIKIYVLLELLACSANEFVADILMPGYCFMVVAAPCSFLYVSLTLYGSMNPFLYLTFPVTSFFWIC
ncbi:unnamed protein product, partial [Allacma fusca]